MVSGILNLQGVLLLPNKFAQVSLSDTEVADEECWAVRVHLSSHTKEIWYSWPKLPKISMTAFFMLP